MAERPFSIAFPKPTSAYIKDVAEATGRTKAEVVASACKAFEERLEPKWGNRRPGDPECEIGIHTGEFDPEFHY